MTDYLDPFDYIPDRLVNEKLETALEDPHEVNFRSNPNESVSFEPEDPLIRNVNADMANRNLEVQYNPQSVEEKYVVVMKAVGLAIVESHANIPIGDYSSKTTVNYHVVTPELGLFYDGDGYVQTRNELPRDAAKKAPELLERAHELDELSPDDSKVLEPAETDTGPDPVPPPAKDRVFYD